uniref:Uncharacterized protein n=1 Tax=Helianthus annuus TaxID=4232 RepID=A0A251U0N5_HELAN
MKAEMEALRLRHAAALELMGERDEEDGLWLCHRKVNLQRIGTRAKYDLNGGGD